MLILLFTKLVLLGLDRKTLLGFRRKKITIFD